MMGKRPLNPVLHHPIKSLISDTINNLFFSPQCVAVTAALTQKQVYYNCDENSKHLQYMFFFKSDSVTFCLYTNDSVTYGLSQ